MTELGPVFARLGLEQYLNRFLEEGFDTWETVLDITESDLDSLNVKLGHRRRLQREIATARGIHIENLVASRARAASAEESAHEQRERSSGPNVTEGKSTSSGKRKYRRHPKPDENAPERPPSAYVIFSNKVREDLKPLNLSFTEIAKQVGEKWQLLSHEEKEPYESEAAASKERYNAQLAKYKRTSNYLEYIQYLADFKAKNAATSTDMARDGKRPKLEKVPSSTSSASSGSQHNTTATPSVTSERYRADSSLPAITPSSSTQTSPLVTQPPLVPLSIAIATMGLSSPPLISPAPISNHRISFGVVPIHGSSQGFPSNDGSYGRGSDQSLTQPVPKILPLEPGVRNSAMMSGNLPPLITEPSILRSFGATQTNPRRTNHMPASFLRHDNSNSSSRSSNLSSGTGSSYATLTPITPIEEESRPRALLPPLSGVSQPSNGVPYVDQKRQALLPAPGSQSFGPISPLQGNYSPSPTSSGKSALPRCTVQYEFCHRHGTQSLARLPINNTRGDIDIPHERHSLMNLSVGDGPTEPRHRLRSHSREIRDLELQHADDFRRQQQQQHHLHSDRTVYDRHVPPGSDLRTYAYRHNAPCESRRESDMDALSVLALAGRIVDRDAQKPP